MALAFLNRCIWRAASSGSGSFVVASAITGYRTPETCANPAVVNSTTYPYFAQSDDKSQWEIGLGVYTTADDTLTRATILDSSNSGSVVTFSAAPSVFMGGLLAQQFPTGASDKYFSIPASAYTSIPIVGDGDTVVQYVSAKGASMPSLSFVGCTSLVNVDFDVALSINSLDLTGCTSLTNLTGSGSNISTITLTGCSAIENIIINNGNLTSIDLSDCVALVSAEIDTHAITSIDLSANVALEAFTMQTNSLSTIDISTNILLIYLFLGGNALSEAAVDGVLADLDTAGLSNGEVDLSGGTNAVPSAAGATSKSNLEGKGWTVTVNV